MMMMTTTMTTTYSPKEENGLYVWCHQQSHYSSIRSVNLVLIKCGQYLHYSWHL
jgi:hypothetical protein